MTINLYIEGVREGSVNGATLTAGFMPANAATPRVLSSPVKLTVAAATLSINGLDKYDSEKTGAFVGVDNAFTKGLTQNGAAAPNYTSPTTFDSNGWQTDLMPATFTAQTTDGGVAGTVQFTYSTSLIGLWLVPSDGSAPTLIQPGEDVTMPSSGLLNLLIEGLTSSTTPLADMITATYTEATSQPILGSLGDWSRYTVVNVNAGFDGDRSGTINPNAPQDQALTFWYAQQLSNAADPSSVLQDYAPLDLSFNSAVANLASGPNAPIDVFSDLALTSIQGSTPLFEAVPRVQSTGAEDYLSNSVMYASQGQLLQYSIANPYQHLIVADGLGAGGIPSGMFLNTNDEQLIFAAEGNGISISKLSFDVDIWVGGTMFQLHKSLTLYLAPITSFFDTFSVSTSAGVNANNPIATPATQPNMASFPGVALGAMSQVTTFPGVSGNQYTLYVHGTNMTVPDQISQATAMYERLYWQGYTGRFGLFSWPNNVLSYTDNTYNASDYSAYLSGASLVTALEYIWRFAQQRHLLRPCDGLCPQHGQ